MLKRIYVAKILAKFLLKVQYCIKNNKSTITFFLKCDILKSVGKMHKSERKKTFFQIECVKNRLKQECFVLKYLQF